MLFRSPEPTEIKNCINYLRYQFLLVQPKIIVCLGRVAAKQIIDPNFRITMDRGKWFDKKDCKVIATFHPSALLRDETKKRPAWEDMKTVKLEYDRVLNP